MTIFQEDKRILCAMHFIFSFFEALEENFHGTDINFHKSRYGSFFFFCNIRSSVMNVDSVR